MSRLIDADDFMEWIDAGHLRHPSELVYSEIDVVNLIAHQPTAYDVEAVVRELEEQRNGEFTDEYTKFCFGKAIEIVKRGGRDEN